MYFNEFDTDGFLSGPTIQLHLLSTVGGATTILRRREPPTIASYVEEFGNNVMILEFILLVKKDIVQSTIMMNSICQMLGSCSLALLAPLHDPPGSLPKFKLPIGHQQKEKHARGSRCFSTDKGNLH